MEYVYFYGVCIFVNILYLFFGKMFLYELYYRYKLYYYILVWFYIKKVINIKYMMLCIINVDICIIKRLKIRWDDIILKEIDSLCVLLYIIFW